MIQDFSVIVPIRREGGTQIGATLIPCFAHMRIHLASRWCPSNSKKMSPRLGPCLTIASCIRKFVCVMATPSTTLGRLAGRPQRTAANDLCLLRQAVQTGRVEHCVFVIPCCNKRVSRFRCVFLVACCFRAWKKALSTQETLAPTTTITMGNHVRNGDSATHVWISTAVIRGVASKVHQ